MRDILKNLSPYKPGKTIEDIKREYNLDNVIKIASNENPYGFSSKVSEAIKNIGEIQLYPDNSVLNLREKLKNKLKVNNSNLIFGTGSSELIGLIARTMLSPDDETITCSPSFFIYGSETLISNGKLINVPLKNNAFDLNGILEKINSRTKLIYIANPNNPTGTIITEEEQRNFLNKVPKNICVVLDEAYYEFAEGKDYPNSINMLKDFNNIIILRTFSKAYGLAGLRVGYGIASEELISNIERVRPPFNLSTIGEIAAAAALEDEEFIKQCVIKNNKVLKYIYEELDKLNISYIKSYANFIMIDVKKDGNIAFEELLRKGFIVRPGFPNMSTYIRVSIGTMEEMKKFIIALKELQGGI